MLLFTCVLWLLESFRRDLNEVISECSLHYLLCHFVQSMFRLHAGIMKHENLSIQMRVNDNRNFRHNWSIKLQSCRWDNQNCNPLTSLKALQWLKRTQETNNTFMFTGTANIVWVSCGCNGCYGLWPQQRFCV